MKIERIYREILIGVIERKEKFYQNGLSKECEVSIGLVNKTIKSLEKIGAIQRLTRGFTIIDPSKIILQWAAKRKIREEIDESYLIKKPVTEIEKTLPGCVIFTAYSGWRLLTDRVPADYREVIVYVPKKEKEMISLWLKSNKPSKGPKNLSIIYTSDNHLIEKSEDNIAPVPQIFVDLYSLASPSSKYFLKDILELHPYFKF